MKIFFFIPSFPHVYNVVGICKQLNPDEYTVGVDISTENMLQVTKIVPDIVKILDKYGIHYVKIDRKNILKNVNYVNYDFWFFSVPYGTKFEAIMAKKLKKINKSIKIFTFQAGIHLDNFDPSIYNGSIDFMLTYGSRWFIQKKNKFNTINCGQPKLNLALTYPEENKYFAIFTQAFSRCTEPKWGNFNPIKFFNWIITAIISVYGKEETKNIIIIEHPSPHYLHSEPYVKTFSKKYNIPIIPMPETIDYYNKIKIGFSYCSTIAFEMKALNKDIIMVNTGKNTSMHFPFRKYGFKMAYTKDQIVKYLETPKNKVNTDSIIRIDETNMEISTTLRRLLDSQKETSVN